MSKNNFETDSSLIESKSEILSYAIHNGSTDSTTSRWDFNHGDLELFQLASKIASSGGKVLDLGAGYMRASMVFALYGMEVTAVDKDVIATRDVRQFADSTGLDVTAMNETFDDFFLYDDPTEQFELVILAQSLVHAPSREGALELIARAYDKVAPGGYIWIRAVTKLDSMYSDLAHNQHANRVDNDVYEIPCSCSGRLQYDPVLFLDPLDIHLLMAQNGAHVVHGQVISEAGQVNVMYGEDYNPHHDIRQGGMVTVLAQKPLCNSTEGL